jgi:hypothetical protein
MCRAHFDSFCHQAIVWYTVSWVPGAGKHPVPRCGSGFADRDEGVKI